MILHGSCYDRPLAETGLLFVRSTSAAGVACCCNAASQVLMQSVRYRRDRLMRTKTPSTTHHTRRVDAQLTKAPQALAAHLAENACCCYCCCYCCRCRCFHWYRSRCHPTESDACPSGQASPTSTTEVPYRCCCCRCILPFGLLLSSPLMHVLLWKARTPRLRTDGPCCCPSHIPSQTAASRGAAAHHTRSYEQGPGSVGIRLLLAHRTNDKFE